MLLPRQLATIICITSTYLCACQSSPTEDLMATKYQNEERQISYGENTKDHKSHSIYHLINPRLAFPENHGQKNSTFLPTSVYPSTTRHNKLKIGNEERHSSGRFTKKSRNQKEDNRKKDSVQQFPRKEDGRRRRRKRKKEKSRRKINDDLSWKINDHSSWDNDVDDVLATLVSYSKDPTLWRFVHSVVDELDYNEHTSYNSRPAMPSPQYSHFNSWSNGEEDISEETTNNELSRFQEETNYFSGEQEHRRDLDKENGKEFALYRKHRVNEEDISEKRDQKIAYKNLDRNFSYQPINYSQSNTTPTPSSLPLLNPPKQFHISPSPYVSSSDSSTIRSPSLSSSSVTSTQEVIRPTHSPHFIFHKVYIDTNYDPHTRQPYHRPVLAVTAVSGDKTAKSTLSNKESGSVYTEEGEDIVSSRLAEQDSRELPDKLEQLLAQQDQEMISMEKKQFKEIDRKDIFDSGDTSLEEGTVDKTDLMYDVTDKNEYFSHMNWRERNDNANTKSSISFLDEGGWHDVLDTSHHRRRFLQRLRHLHSFESQMKFLRRWHERLLRKRRQWSNSSKPSIT